MTARNQSVALDTNTLIDRALEEPHARTFFDLLATNQWQKVVTNTVLGELADGSNDTQDKRRSVGSTAALRRLREWNVGVFYLRDEQLTRAFAFSERLRNSGDLDARERNDGALPAEASLAGCGWFATEDTALLGIEEERWELHFQLARLHPVRIVSVREFIRRATRLLP